MKNLLDVPSPGILMSHIASAIEVLKEECKVNDRGDIEKYLNELFEKSDYEEELNKLMSGKFPTGESSFNSYGKIYESQILDCMLMLMLGIMSSSGRKIGDIKGLWDRILEEVLDKMSF